MVDFATGLIDWGDKKAVQAFTDGLVKSGQLSAADQQTLIKASIICVNLGIRLTYDSTAGKSVS